MTLRIWPFLRKAPAPLRAGIREGDEEDMTVEGQLNKDMPGEIAGVREEYIGLIHEDFPGMTRISYRASGGLPRRLIGWNRITLLGHCPADLPTMKAGNLPSDVSLSALTILPAGPIFHRPRRMPKKRSVKNQARFYTASHARPRIAVPEENEVVKDVNTQLQELRMEEGRERLQSSKSSISAINDLPHANALGFIPADYTEPVADCPIGRTSTRRVPGPAAPRSWLERPRHNLRRLSIPEVIRSRTDLDPPFPDIEMPSRKSLLHLSLLFLATHFYAHQEANQYILPQLGVHLKELLLTYIAAKNIGGAITKEGLDVLFPYKYNEDDPEEMKEIVALSRKDDVHVRFLDLSDSLGSDLLLSQFRTFLSPPAYSMNILPEKLSDNIPGPRFHNLTHLTLDASPVHPPKFNTVRLAEILSENCTRLTHLSIAGVFTSAASGAALILLSKNLVCLEYIDLSRTPALRERYGMPVMSSWSVGYVDLDHEREGRLVDRLNWGGAWRLVRTLVVRKSGFTSDSGHELQDHIIKLRHGKGWKGWIQVVTDK